MPLGRGAQEHVTRFLVLCQVPWLKTRFLPNIVTSYRDLLNFGPPPAEILLNPYKHEVQNMIFAKICHQLLRRPKIHAKFCHVLLRPSPDEHSWSSLGLVQCFLGLYF